MRGNLIVSLVDHLIASGHKHITVLDLSSAALKQAGMTWRFHFLTELEKQSPYMDRVHAALKPGVHVIIGAFASDGSEKCGDLPVAQHNATKA